MSETNLNAVKYIRISQALPTAGFAHTYEGIKAAAYDLFMPEKVNKYFLETEVRPPCLWGTGVYQVNEDGTLRLVQSDWDSSD